MKLFFLEKSERKYILMAGAFAFIYFSILVPLAVRILDDSNIFLEFALLNVGFLIVIQIWLKSMATNSKPKLKNILGLLFLLLALSTWSVPYSTKIDGSLAQPTSEGPILILGATDYVWGTLLTNWGVHGGITIPNFIPYIGGTFIGWVFVGVYTIFPILMLLAASKFLKNSTNLV